MLGNDVYAKDACAGQIVGRAGHPPTFKDQLQAQKEEIEYRLAAINAALKAMEESPELSKLVEAIRRAGIY